MKAIIAALALGAIAFAPLPALAGQARASGNVDVHSGPGDNYRTIAKLRNGRYYEVLDCTRQARWCLVGDDYDVIGWVRGSSIVGSPAKVRVTPFEFQVTPDIFKRK